MPWERKKKLVKDGSSWTKLPFFPGQVFSCGFDADLHQVVHRPPSKGKTAHYGTTGNAVIVVACAGNYQNTKAVIFRKCIQRALHMNEPMNKNDVVFMSDLCGRTAKVGAGWPRRGIKALDEAQFAGGQGIITRKEGSRRVGPEMHLAALKILICLWAALLVLTSPPSTHPSLSCYRYTLTTFILIKNTKVQQFPSGPFFFV